MKLEHSKSVSFGARNFHWQIWIKLVNFHSRICDNASSVERFESGRDSTTKIRGSPGKSKNVLRHWAVVLGSWAVRRLEALGNTRLYLACAGHIA